MFQHHLNLKVILALILDLFEKLTERNVEKRLTLNEVRNHPWTTGKILEPFELIEEMKDRIQLFEKLYRQELEIYKSNMEERKMKYQWDTERKSCPEIVKDSIMHGFISECLEINEFLEKQRNTSTVHAPDEKLSDDQVSSVLDNDFKEKFDEGEVKERAEAEIIENFESDIDKH